MVALAPGLVTGLSLIVAIGAQNAFVLRQGLRREHVGTVVAICAVCDIALILVGVQGIGAVAERYPLALEALRWGGVAYLTWFAISSFRAAIRPAALRASDLDRRGRRAVARTTLTLTLLNPHVYLDTVVMLGAVANQYGAQDRWWFATGAAAGSVLWFSGLGLGATAAARWLDRPAVWRAIDASVGIVMLLIAWRLIVA